MYGWGRSASCTKCSSIEPIGGAEKGAVNELENEFIGLRRKMNPMDTGFDYGSLVNILAVEMKLRKFNQLYLRLEKARGARTCSLCMGKGVNLEKTQYGILIITLDGSGDECTTATEMPAHYGDRLQVIRQITIRAAAVQECTPGFSRPINLPVSPPADTADLLRMGGDLRMKKGISASLLAEATNSYVCADDLRGMLLLSRGKQKRATDPDIIRSIQRFIRTNTGWIGDTKHYAKVRGKSVYCEVAEKDACEKSTPEIMAKMERDNNTELPEVKKKCRWKKIWIRV